MKRGIQFLLIFGITGLGLTGLVRTPVLLNLFSAHLSKNVEYKLQDIVYRYEGDIKLIKVGTPKFCPGTAVDSDILCISLARYNFTEIIKVLGMLKKYKVAKVQIENHPILWSNYNNKKTTTNNQLISALGQGSIIDRKQVLLAFNSISKVFSTVEQKAYLNYDSDYRLPYYRFTIKHYKRVEETLKNFDFFDKLEWITGNYEDLLAFDYAKEHKNKIKKVALFGELK